MCIFLGDVYQHQSAAGYVQIVDALECVIQDMLSSADRPTEAQLDRFDRLYAAAVVHRYADTGSR